MDCTLIDGELVGFHFGALGDGDRALVESHLPGCARCLSAYLELKRAIETGGGEARPSEAARLKLRAAVAAEVARPRARPGWMWGGAAAALFVLAALVGVFAHPDSPAPRAPELNVRDVDSARPTAASLNVL